MRSSRSILLAAGLAASTLFAVSAYHAGAQQGAAAAAARQIAPAKIATVDLIGILQRLVESPEYVAARTAVEEEWSAQIQPLEAELRQMQDQLGAAGQDDPNAATLRTQFQAKFQQYQQLSQQSQQAIQQIQLQQLTEGYEKITAAADAVAQREGYTHVMITRSDEAGIQPQTLFQDILSRPVLTAPAEDDITDKIIAELNIPEPAAPAEGQPEGNAGEPAPEGGNGGQR